LYESTLDVVLDGVDGDDDERRWYYVGVPLGFDSVS
jgi:hypothetical protein